MDVLEQYRIRPRALPETLSRDDLGWPTWCRLVRDGVLRQLWGDVALRGDLVATPARRAVALAHLVPPRGVVGRQSAVWLHTGQLPPSRVDVLVGTGARRPDPHPLRTTTEAALAPGDVTRLGPVRATTVQRTGIDVCRCVPTEQALTLLAPLLDVGFDVPAAQRQLAQLGGFRGVRRARRLLDQLLDQLGAVRRG